MVSGANAADRIGGSRADFPVCWEGAPLGEIAGKGKVRALPGGNALPAMRTGDHTGGISVRIAIQIRELVSSNLNTLVEAAANPVKMLRLMQRELQECIVALQGDFTRAERRRERRAGEALAHDRAALDWTDKAQVAMNHKREDLARAALLAREQTAADADQARAEAQAADDEAREIAQAIGELEAKLAETDARLADEAARAGTKPAAADAASRSERMLDRVATLERRVDFAAGRRAEPAPASVDAEIAQLQRDARVAEELAAMKAAAGTTKAPRKPKAKG